MTLTERRQLIQDLHVMMDIQLDNIRKGDTTKVVRFAGHYSGPRKGAEGNNQGGQDHSA